MITTFSLPIWILVGVVTFADICLLFWCFTLMRRSRNTNLRAAIPEEAMAGFEQPRIPAHQFQHNLVDLQIDAVFDGLAALIDTERIKLKSLLGQMASPNSCAPRPQDAGPEESEDRIGDVVEEQAADLAQQIAQIAASGQRPAGIANQLGISLAEVELAMKMQATRRTAAPTKLEAVA